MGRNQRQTLSFLVCRDSLYLCVSKDLLYSFVCVSKSNNRQGPWISFFFDSREIVFSVLYVRVCSGILLYNLMWANRSQFFSFLFSNVNWNVAENSQLLSFSTLFYDWVLTLNFLDQYGRQLCQCRWLPLSSLNLSEELRFLFIQMIACKDFKDIEVCCFPHCCGSCTR